METSLWLTSVWKHSAPESCAQNDSWPHGEIKSYQREKRDHLVTQNSPEPSRWGSSLLALPVILRGIFPRGPQPRQKRPRCADSGSSFKSAAPGQTTQPVQRPRSVPQVSGGRTPQKLRVLSGRAFENGGGTFGLDQRACTKLGTILRSFWSSQGAPPIERYVEGVREWIWEIGRWD